MMSARAELREAQRDAKSSVATRSLHRPFGLDAEVVYRLETTRLRINAHVRAHQWLKQPLHPMLTEACDPKAMWSPDALRRAILEDENLRKLPRTPVLIEDYLQDYRSLHDSVSAF